MSVNVIEPHLTTACSKARVSADAAATTALELADADDADDDADDDDDDDAAAADDAERDLGCVSSLAAAAR